MKIGISLAGISYSEIWRKRDFRNCYQNFYETIYNPLKDDNELSVYVTTYPHQFNDELLKTYNPKKHQFIDYENSHPRKTFMHSLCLLEDESLDILLCTRFDIKFNQKITDLNVDYTKFNILFKENYLWEAGHYVCDNLFVLPFKYLYSFADAIEEMENDKNERRPFMHHVYNPLEAIIGEENIHFMSPELNYEQTSFSNKFYTLDRTDV